MKDINFTYSCTEKINERTYFCDVCRLHVLDISGMKEQHVKELIKANNGSMCATFDESQFSFIKDVSEPISFKWKRYLAASLVSASLLGPVKTNAQVKVEYEVLLMDSLKRLKPLNCGYDTVTTSYYSRKRLNKITSTDARDTCSNEVIRLKTINKKLSVRLFRVGRTSVGLKTSFPFVYVHKRRFRGRLW